MSKLHPTMTDILEALYTQAKNEGKTTIQLLREILEEHKDLREIENDLVNQLREEGDGDET